MLTSPEKSPPVHLQFMRKKLVAFELGISRHTLARMIKIDADFPVFFEISPGIEVIERPAFDRWLQIKRVKHRLKPV